MSNSITPALKEKIKQNLKGVVFVIYNRIATGKSFIPVLINILSKDRKVRIGHTHLEETFTRNANVEVVDLVRDMGLKGQEANEEMPNFVKQFIEETLSKERICILDGVSSHQNCRKKILDIIQQDKGTIVIGYSAIGKFSLQEEKEALILANTIIDCSGISEAHNKTTYKEMGINPDKIIWIDSLGDQFTEQKLDD